MGHCGERDNDKKQDASCEFLKTKVRGKICPRCGKPGSIVYQTKERIVFECPNGHQFEMKLGKNRGMASFIKFKRGSFLPPLSPITPFQSKCGSRKKAAIVCWSFFDGVP